MVRRHQASSMHAAVRALGLCCKKLASRWAPEEKKGQTICTRAQDEERVSVLSGGGEGGGEGGGGGGKEGDRTKGAHLALSCPSSNLCKRVRVLAAQPSGMHHPGPPSLWDGKPEALIACPANRQVPPSLLRTGHTWHHSHGSQKQGPESLGRED